MDSATDPTGKTTQFVYDGKNNLIQITDRLGRITRFTYDAKGNLITALDAAGGASAFVYDSAGEVVAAKNARNFTTGFNYDVAGNLTRVTDALGGAIQMTYDAAGRLLSVKNQLGKTATRTYDLNNRLLTTADPLGNTTHFSYDPNGNLTQITDANNKVTRYSYDSTNKLSQVTDAIGGVTRYAYNGNTDLTSVIDANNHTTTYAYDALRRLTGSTDPLGRQKRYSYNAAGNITSTLDGNFKTNNFTYDALNRLTSMSLADGKTVAYTYDAVGNRLTMNDWRGFSSYFYDALNRALSVTTPDGKSVGYQYDAVGNRAKLTYPDGKAVQYGFDSLNRLTLVTDWAGKTSTYAYDAASNLTRMDHPNHASSLYTYDPASRMIAILNLSGQRPISGFGYLLDKVGNRSAVISSAGGIDIYGYDDLYRLTSWTDPFGRGTRYSYDPVGNRLSMAAPAGTTNYSYDAADQLLTADATTFTYDGNGSQLTKTTTAGTATYGWDALNGLISLTGAGLNTQYVYDGDGNRVGQQVGANAYHYLNDTATALPVTLNESGPDGNINYIYGESLISATSVTFQSFYQFDGLGSVANITNQSGTLAANYAYDPWGQPAKPELPPFGVDTLGTKNKYRFTGEALDTNDGLLFLRSRYYDASLGRFISKDPLPMLFDLPATSNRYQYALSNPGRYIDPSGFTFITTVSGIFHIADIVETVQNFFSFGQSIQTMHQHLQDTINSCTNGVSTGDSCDLEKASAQNPYGQINQTTIDSTNQLGNLGKQATSNIILPENNLPDPFGFLKDLWSRIKEAVSIPTAQASGVDHSISWQTQPLNSLNVGQPSK